jgi:hypothetical protein
VKTRRSISVLLAAMVGATLVQALPVQAAGVAGTYKTLGTDDEGDWGKDVDGNIAGVGNATGQDLIEAGIELADKETLNFIIKLKSLPSWGGMPETVRYTWEFAVDGEAFQLSGGFTEFVRGTCNPLSTNTCPPPRNPGQAPFFIRYGPCTVGSECFEAALVSAKFDPAEATITVPVPMEAIKAKTGSKITPGASLFGGTIYAAPGLLVTQAALPHDTMLLTETYTVPGAKAKKKKKK